MILVRTLSKICTFCTLNILIQNSSQLSCTFIERSSYLLIYNMRSSSIDYFGLENYTSSCDIRIEMLDYTYVKNCTSLDELKGILSKLYSGKEGSYPDLEKATEGKILDLLPTKERKKIISMQKGCSLSQVNEEVVNLQNWNSQIQQKDNILRKKVEELTCNNHDNEKKNTSRILPPVRGQLQNPKKNVDEHSKKVSKEEINIKAYDWKGWESYDVDTVLNEMDLHDVNIQNETKKNMEDMEERKKQRLKELASLSSNVQVNSMSRVERDVYATQEKNKGNECFKVGETEESILYYTRSMAFCDTSAIVYANRALSRLKLKQFQSAEEDCTRAVELDPSYVKGWIRRGITRHRRGKYKEAIKDFEKAVSLDTSNMDLQKLLEKTRAKYREVEGEQFTKITILDSDSEEETLPSFQNMGKLDKGFQRVQIIEEESDEEERPRFEVLSD